MKIKNFWENSFLRNFLWISEKHPLRTCRNFLTDYRKTLGSKSDKILAKKNESSRKKTVASNVSSLHVKSMLRRTIQVFWVESLVFLLSKSGSFWTQIRKKTLSSHVSPGHVKCSFDKAVKLFRQNPAVFVHRPETIENPFLLEIILQNIFSGH